MPRRHRSARDRPEPLTSRRPGWLPPAGTEAEGYTIRQTSGEKAYTCPGCRQVIQPGTRHLVVFPDDQPDLRKHWHTPCWERERKLIR